MCKELILSILAECGGDVKKRKACKDCSCGLAEEIEAEKQNGTVAATAQQNAKSSCGSVSSDVSLTVYFLYIT